MKLNFEEHADRIIALAERAANQYVKITKNVNALDDAKCDAYLYAVEIELDEARTEKEQDSFIVQKIVGKLIDSYRKHNARRDANFDLSNLKTERVENEEPVIADFKELEEAFDRIANLRVPINRERSFLSDRERGVILDYLNCKLNARQKNDKAPLLHVAKKYGMTQGRASQIMQLFKRRARMLIDLDGRGVMIVDVLKTEPTAAMRLETPLFYAEE